jgi:hypothetical protein
VKVLVRLSLFIVLLLSAVLGATAPAHAAPDTPAPERTPTTCSQSSNEIAGRITLDADHDNCPMMPKAFRVLPSILRTSTPARRFCKPPPPMPKAVTASFAG